MYIIPSILRQVLSDNGFDYSKVTRGFKERDYLEIQTDNKGHTKMQMPRRINGVLQKCFCVKVVTDIEKENLVN